MKAQEPFKWEKVGQTSQGEAVYKNVKTGEMYVERDYLYLEPATEWELAGMKGERN